MDRREFLRAALAGPPALAVGGAGADPALRAKGRMKIGHQHQHSEEALRTLSSFGVTHICSGQISPKLDENWSVESLTRLRERVESHGIRLEMLSLPLSSFYITRAENPHIMLGQSPERDREIDGICQMIRNAGMAGIPAVKYNLTILGVLRTESTPGRGAARYSTFDYSRAAQEPPLTEAGPVSEEQMWERITYFLDRVVPVAEESKVRICCHPHDPAVPRDKGFRGVHRVLGTVDGLKRLVSIRPSPYHGLNFCQGTVSEMLEHPGHDIYDVIRWFGSRGKIFNVHFRNIRGGFLKFQETFPDDGDVDMVRALRTYQEVGYDGMVMPDHVPQVPGDTGGLQAFAYCFGYILAMLQVVQGEA